MGVAYLDGRLYAVGGHDGNQHLNSVECYDPRQGTWQYVQPMRTLRRGIAVGAIGGPMYAVGEREGERRGERGSGRQGEGVAVVCSAVECLLSLNPVGVLPAMLLMGC